MEHWEAIAEYEDGFSIEKNFPYRANGNYAAEEREQYKIECWLASFANEHGAWTYYTVNYIAE